MKNVKMADIVYAMDILVPGAKYVIGERNAIEWLDSRSQPTETELLSTISTNKLKEAKESRYAEVLTAFNEALGQLTSTYPQLERETWSIQEEEARAYVADSTAATPALDALATARGVTKDILATKIVAKADQYRISSLQLIGKKQALEEAINNATTLKELDAIVW